MKKTLYSLILLIILSCSENENNENRNGSPSDFEVTVNSSSYINVEISWSESFDPENETVKYSVYLENEELANNIIERNYNFQNLLTSTAYRGQVIASDPNGSETIASFSFTTIENLPPSDFELINVTPSNVSLDISWTEAIDPEDENVVYDLYLNNQLIVSNHEQEYFLFTNLSAANIYNIKIEAKDEAGNVTNLVFDEETLDGVYQGDVSLRTQSGVNNFGALGYIEITGNLEMDALAAFTDVYDLSPLNSIKKVRGYFTINFMDDLTSLAGLGIEHIGYSFRITRNQNLQNLNGLENLSEVLGELEIEQNGSLQDISSINNLTQVGSILSIYNNIALTNIEGFNSLNSVDYIFINANWSLTQINAFSNVSELTGDLSIVDNTSLTSISGFNNIEQIGRVFIKNTQIQNFDTFSSLSIVGGDLDVANNSSLNNIQGLSPLTEITYGNLSFFNNTSLSSLNGLENLTQIGNTVNFVGNSSLSDFCALQTVMQTFIPSSNPSIYNNLFNPTITEISNGNCSN